MRQHSSSGLNLLEGPVWSAKAQEAMMVLEVQAAYPDRDEA